MSNQKLIYVHIPKTGGSTLQAIIIRQCGKKKFFRINRKNSLEDFNLLDKKNINLLVGHFPFGYHTYFDHPEDVQYLSLIRNPITRLVSNYYHILARENNPHHSMLVENNYSIKEFIELGVNGKTENCYVRFFSNNINAPHNSCTTKMLEQAKKNIKTHFPIVGITELYDESILLMKNHFGWKQPYYTTKNKARIKYSLNNDVDEDTIETIKQYNQLDIELYNWAKKRLEAQIESSEINIEKQVESFRNTNKIVQTIVPIRNRIIGRKN